MKKIFKKLVSVPNKFEAFLQRRNFPTLILILTFCLFTLFNLWWYGAYENLFKSGINTSSQELEDAAVQEVYRVYPDAEAYPEQISDEEWEIVYGGYLTKRFSRMTTNELVDIIFEENFCPFLWSAYAFDPCPSVAYEGILNKDNHTLQYFFFRELQTRKDASVKIAKRYLKTPVFSIRDGETKENWNSFVVSELLLSQPEYQKHLPPWYSVERLREEKQKEEFSWIGTAEAKACSGGEDSFVSGARYNYLYTDAYDENGWDEEKLNEYASKYIDLAEWGFTE